MRKQIEYTERSALVDAGNVRDGFTEELNS